MSPTLLQQQQQRQRHNSSSNRSQYDPGREILTVMDRLDPLTYPLPNQLRKAGITRIIIESPYLVLYRKDKILFHVRISGNWKKDIHKIRHGAELFLESYDTAQLLVHELSLTDYFVDLQQNEKALHRLRDLAGYNVARSILSSLTNNNEGIKSTDLTKILEETIDVNAYQANRVIERLVRAGKLIEIARASSDSDITLILS